MSSWLELVGQYVLPVEYAQAEALAQLRGEQVDVAAKLPDVGRHVGAPQRGGVVAHAEVGVVLYLLDGHSQAGVGLLVGEQTLDARARLVVQSAVVPPQVLRVVVALVERGCEAIEVGLGRQRHGVAPQTEVYVGAEVGLQLSEVLAGEPRLGLRGCSAACAPVSSGFVRPRSQSARSMWPKPTSCCRRR